MNERKSPQPRSKIKWTVFLEDQALLSGESDVQQAHMDVIMGVSTNFWEYCVHIQLKKMPKEFFCAVKMTKG